MFRRGTTKDLSIVIAEVEADKAALKTSARDEKSKLSAAGQAFGLGVSELSEAQKKELKIKGGVKVDTAVDAAARSGLREGDVIVAVANTAVGSVKEFDAVLSKVDKNKPLNVLFRRGEWTQYVLIRPAH